MTLLPVLLAVAATQAAPVDPVQTQPPGQGPAVEAAAPICPASAAPAVPAPPPLTGTPAAAAPPAPIGPPPPTVPVLVATADPNGEIVVTADPQGRKEDPLRGVNAASFAVVNKIDDAVVGPLAQGYKHAIPEPARDGLHNALSNLTEPVVFVNDLLQFHPVRAGKTLLRFVINSTIGLGGLFDVAKKKPFKIAHHNNGFADTLGYYGVKPGPYLYLPLIGPTTLRDVFGRVIDLSLLPIAVGAPFNKPEFSLPQSALKSLDDRLTFDARQHYLREQTADPYASERHYYLEIRANEIAGLHGKHPELSEQFGSAPPATVALPPQCPPVAPPNP